MRTVIVALGLASCASHVLAVHKCPVPNGGVQYQEQPCPEGQKVNTSGAGRADPAATRDWQAEAALSGRLAAVNAAIIRGEPLVGMTEAELAKAMGQPSRANLGNYGGVQSHQLIYDRGNRTWYVYTRDGVVTSIQNSERVGGVPPSEQAAELCPSPLSIRNMETSASSITLGEAERIERLRAIRELRARCP